MCAVIDRALLLAHVGDPLARAAEAVGADPVDLALNGGEDYALVAASSAAIEGFSRVGEVREGEGVEGEGVEGEGVEGVGVYVKDSERGESARGGDRIRPFRAARTGRGKCYSSRFPKGKETHEPLVPPSERCRRTCKRGAAQRVFLFWGGDQPDGGTGTHAEAGGGTGDSSGGGGGEGGGGDLGWTAGGGASEGGGGGSEGGGGGSEGGDAGRGDLHDRRKQGAEPRVQPSVGPRPGLPIHLWREPRSLRGSKRLPGECSAGAAIR